MKNDFLEYLKKLGMSSPFQERVKQILEFYMTCCGIDAKDIFISDYIDSEGKRLYESLWLFTEDFVCEAKQFLTQDIFDAMPIKNNFLRWEIQKTEYDFKHTYPKSRLTVSIYFGENIAGNLKASGDNCDDLRNIFRKYILPNIYKS